MNPRPQLDETRFPFSCFHALGDRNKASVPIPHGKHCQADSRVEQPVPQIEWIAGGRAMHPCPEPTLGRHSLNPSEMLRRKYGTLEPMLSEQSAQHFRNR